MYMDIITACKIYKYNCKICFVRHFKIINTVIFSPQRICVFLFVNIIRDKKKYGLHEPSGRVKNRDQGSGQRPKMIDFPYA